MIGFAGRVVFFLLVLLQSHVMAMESGRIFFCSSMAGNWDVWSMKPDGTELREITSTPEDERSPAVSPDGREILFVDQNRGISMMEADGSNRRTIPLPIGIYGQPAWKPDGQGIVFVKYRVLPADESEIWFMKRENGAWREPERISTFPPMRLYPSFSPDGTKLLYTEFHRDKLLGVVEEIGVLDLAKHTFQRITDHAADSFDAVWSPAGEEIAYTSNKAGNYDVWLFSSKSGKHRPLTACPGFDGEAAWSPEGRALAFVSTRTGKKELWVLTVAGGHPRLLTTLGKTCIDPFWAR